MLELKNITKDYVSGDSTVQALKGISIEFRKSEFVSILGQSGCGKTTLLNIIGGLDRYTSGDLVINGKSTKKFKDKDWDAYRNYSVGFVFQNYNLIPHQTVLSNVELALTISGVSREERKERAIKALEEENIKFSYISGTSSGSIVAMLYACGYNVEEMYNIFYKYSKSIHYVDWVNIKKFFLNILTGKGIKIDGLNSGTKIYKLVTLL